MHLTKKPKKVQCFYCKRKFPDGGTFKDNGKDCCFICARNGVNKK